VKVVEECTSVILVVSMANQSVNELIVDGTTKVRSAEFLLIVALCEQLWNLPGHMLSHYQ
jgi:hypothetical protein